MGISGGKDEVGGRELREGREGWEMVFMGVLFLQDFCILGR